MPKIIVAYKVYAEDCHGCLSVFGSQAGIENVILHGSLEEKDRPKFTPRLRS